MSMIVQQHPVTVMRWKQVQAVTGFGHAWIYELMKRGEFPKARKIGKRAVGWNSAEVYAWIDARIGGQA